MHLIRKFEETAEASYMRGLIHGTMHLSIGQEASAVGATLPLRADDYILSTHRGHGHCIAKGADPARMFAEFFGKENGYCRGRGGSMHIADVEGGNLGANGIVAGGLPIAVGVGMSIKAQKQDRVCVVFFGDGAANEGAFHEALNLASIWKLPIVFVCENNKYGMSMDIARAMAVPNVADRASAYAMPGVVVDGNDLAAVVAATGPAIERARRGCGPTLVECKTYRLRGHSKSDRNLYRTKEEIESWREKDAIRRLERELIVHARCTAAELLAIEQAAQQTIDDALAFAKASPDPDPRELTRDVYADCRPTELAALEVDTRELSYAAAIREGLAQAMEADERVFLFGEDVGVYGGAFGVSGDLFHRFGPERVIDTPISELGIAGAAVGAAITGMKPVLELQFSDFVTLAMEQIVNQAAKIRFMFGGKATVPMVIRLPGGSGTGAAAQHSQSLEAWFAHVPGLKVLQPSTPHDAKGLLLAAIDDPNPVLIFEHKLLYKTKGPVPAAPYRIPIGKAAVRRTGRDLTIVGTSIMSIRAEAAAVCLAREDIDAEVIDLRSLRPIDFATIAASVRKTHRLLIVYEGVKIMGIGAEISAMIAESDAFDFLDAPIARLGGADAPLPYNPVLEKAAVPQEDDIVAAARRLVREGRA